MITKFKTINNLAVFQNFNWDTTIRDGGNNVVSFKKINIFYGRNYSGKTTLSRIVRALETGIISDKYENPLFEVCIQNFADTTPNNLIVHGKKIRVFNEDFVKDNLRFIVNSDENISPFAIIGGNATIEQEIKKLKDDLGQKEDVEKGENASGFYLELKNASIIANITLKALQTENNNLDQQLAFKATNNPNGIKYKSEKFGEQNYNINKLQNDITTVLNASFQSLTDDEVTQKLNLLNERANADIPAIAKPNLDLNLLNTKAKELVTKSIISSNKIEQLLKDAILNRWVKEGRQLHKDKLEQCSFCGNDISKVRWNELDSHFDEESEKLEKEINELIFQIDISIRNVDTQLPINKNAFYSKFHLDLDTLISQRQQVINNIKFELNRVREKLQERKDDLLNIKTYVDITDNSKQLENCWIAFESFRSQANDYSKSLGNEQTEAKKLLRLREVSDFVITIQYTTVKTTIQTLKDTSDNEVRNRKVIEEKIKELNRQIEEKERLMKDEEKGALKVNEYLNNFFGHDFLTLQAIEQTDKKIRFEIFRNGKKAHHLSEGECSLIAFCYFMAKLEDIETKGSKPIIWIDDPISSLDSNHIFFVYSLINAEIIAKKEFEQIFISTHNLDFLKYLKKIKFDKNDNEFFVISREGKNSVIKLMPKYLKDYTTEFNYLFDQIYKCAKENDLSEANQHVFYNFGNNARKFLEALLFYKYPSRIDNQTSNANSKRLLKFFGDNHQATVLTDRVNNELSHLEEIFDRGTVPIEIPEIKKVAQFILDKIKHNDNDQYEALLESIGVEIET